MEKNEALEYVNIFLNKRNSGKLSIDQKDYEFIINWIYYKKQVRVSMDQINYSIQKNIFNLDNILSSMVNKVCIEFNLSALHDKENKIIKFI